MMKKPEGDVASERAVLAGIFRYGGDCYLDVADIVSPGSFTVESNRAIWRCLDSILRDSPTGHVDVPSVISAAKTVGLDGYFDKKEEWEHLRAISNMPIHMQNVPRLAAQVKKLEIARELVGQMELAGEDLANITGTESVDKILSIPEGYIFDYTMQVANAGNRGIIRMGEGAEEYFTHLMDTPREMIGIPTPYARYNLVIGGGYRPNSLDVIVGRMKSGKSQIVDNVCLHIAAQNIPTLNLDTEMDHESHLVRVGANMAGVPVHDIERGKCRVGSQDRAKVMEAARKLKDMPYFYRCVNGEAFEETLANIRRWVIKEVGLGPDGKAKPCVVFYDYLKVMDPTTINKFLSEHQALGFITTALKNFAGRYGVACPCMAQANRAGIDREESDVIAGSDRIGMFATSVSLYKEKTDEEKAGEVGRRAKYTHKLVPMFSRYGEGLPRGDYINMRAEYHIGRVTEGPTALELVRGDTGQPKGEIVNGDGGEDINFNESVP